ncbi:hypothetical protein [Candidatus Phytoplasma ziziphi]|nr:hypothetical protein [Candidatus Phytoplasma ziziphi]
MTGGEKRGADEAEDEEGEYIPKYTLDNLKSMKNGATKIYLFKKNNKY